MVEEKELQEELDLLELIRVLRRRWLLIALTFLFSVIAAAIISLRMTPVYESKTTILVKDESKSEMANLFMNSFGSLGKNTVMNYVEILKSRFIAEKVVEKLGLDIKIPSEEFEGFRRNIFVQPVKETDLLAISVRSTDPALARQIADTIVEIFQEQTMKTNQESARLAREFIAEQLSIVADKLAKAEEALVTYKQREKIIEPQAEIKAQLEKVIKLETLAEETEIGIKDIQSKLGELRNLFAGEPRMVTASQTVTENPLLKEYQSHLSELEVTLAGEQQKYTAQHPLIASLKAEINEIKSKINQETARIVASETSSINPVYQELLRSIVTAEAELAGLEARKKILQELIKENETFLTSLPRNELNIIRLTRDKEVTQQLYVMLLEKMEEIRIQEVMQVSSIQRVDYASLPEVGKPVKPKKRLNLAVAAVIGLLGGIGLSFLIEFLDNTVKTPEEVEKLLALPLLGEIPNIQEVKRRRKGKSGPKPHSKTVVEQLKSKL